jgi:hypothetical protein
MPLLISLQVTPDPVLKKGWRKKEGSWTCQCYTVGLTFAETAHGDLLAEEKIERAINRAVNHAPEFTGEEDPGLLPPSTMPPRLEESGSTKRTRGRTLDFMALHIGPCFVTFFPPPPPHPHIRDLFWLLGVSRTEELAGNGILYRIDSHAPRMCSVRSDDFSPTVYRD